MRPSRLLIAAASLAGTSLPSLAHPGHVGSQAGHTHWFVLAVIAATAITLAVGVGRHLVGRARTAREARRASAPSARRQHQS